MNLRTAIAGAAVLAAAGLLLAPVAPAQAAPVPAMYDMVCGTLDNRPSLQSVNFMMRNYSTLLFTRQNAWDTIVNGMARSTRTYSGCTRRSTGTDEAMMIDLAWALPMGLCAWLAWPVVRDAVDSWLP